MSRASTTASRSDADIHLLVLNNGSWSLKFGLYRVNDVKIACLLAGAAEGLGEATTSFYATDAQGGILVRESAVMATADEAVVRINHLLTDIQSRPPQAIGHRIAHGCPSLFSTASQTQKSC